MKPTISLRKALHDPGLLGHTLRGASWANWRTLLIAAMGEPLTNDERPIFTSLTGRAQEPLQRIEEFVGVIGRRGGKSRAISVLATYVAGLCNHPALVPGERGVLLVIAPDQRQADICLDYTEACFSGSPILKQLVEARTARALRLTNRIDVEVRASDFRRLRGNTYIAVIADECAFWPNENSVSPDSEILNAVRPGLATTGGPLFIISSPYARRGELWRLYSRHYGPAGDPLILVAQAATRTMNPSLPQSVVDRATERDAAAAAAEYGAQFRTDLEAYVTREAIEACIDRGIRERPPGRGISYHACVDPSGGSSDSMTLAIGHVDYVRETVIVDAIREATPPFSPEQVVEEFCNFLKTYRIATVKGDKYAGDWPREQFGKFGVTYDPDLPDRSRLYTDALAMLNSARVVLLDHSKMCAQFLSLERRTGRVKDVIDHPPGAHDDVANAVAGLIATGLAYGGYDQTYRGFRYDDDDPDGARAFRAARLAQHIARYS